MSRTTYAVRMIIGTLVVTLGVRNFKERAGASAPAVPATPAVPFASKPRQSV
jgi:hypothetical protein